MPDSRTNVVPISQRTPSLTPTPTPPSSLEGLPLMLSIDEAAAVLRISRTSAYKLAEQFRATNGQSGLPHVRLGGRLLVGRVDLAAIVGQPPSLGDLTTT